MTSKAPNFDGATGGVCRVLISACANGRPLVSRELPTLWLSASDLSH